MGKNKYEKKRMQMKREERNRNDMEEDTKIKRKIRG
jgi:hypothetical protein